MKSKQILILSSSNTKDGWGEFTNSFINVLNESNIDFDLRIIRRGKFRNFDILQLILNNLFIQYDKLFCLTEDLFPLVLKFKIRYINLHCFIHGTYGSIIEKSINQYSINQKISVSFVSSYTSMKFSTLHNLRNFIHFPYSYKLIGLEKKPNISRLTNVKELRILYIGNSKERKGLSLILNSLFAI